ncbi:MAG: crotonyl-CoA carboxylase/reductase [Chloroflexi bacterium]|nr:crotonyl-CoA carboxylase/reductase [Chloroflexota bacterium]
MVSVKDVYEIGEIPPLGTIPRQMYAQVIRRERFGEPAKAFQTEKVDVPTYLKPDEALVFVMAAGINYNNVWASLGVPVDVIKVHEREGDPSGFHIGGSDASGIVYAVGDEVTNVKIGDRVVVHCGWWDREDPYIKAGGDPMIAPSARIWGYETNWGSFAQFAKVQAHQCLPKAPQLTWEAAAAPTLVGATAYRMLHGWPPNTVKDGDVVLVWGGSGGLGSMAIQIAREAGAVPVAVVSSESKFEFCQNLGAKGCINRKKFDHWGMPPHWDDTEAFGRWAEGARAFGKAIWEIVGERRSPAIVLEHPGEDTIPTSIFVCDNGGMVVICAGTTGFSAVVDLRYLWMRQKRFQGSHFANDDNAAAFNQLVVDGKVDPCLSRVFAFEEISVAHQLMYENKHPEGNMVALVSAPREGLTELP